VHGFEGGYRKLTRNNVAAIRRALETEGIKLLFDDDGAPIGIVRDKAPDL
jgi:hypothetical protein